MHTAGSIDVNDVDPATRRRIARLIKRQRRTVLARWEERHRRNEALAVPVEELGGWEVYRKTYLDLLLRALVTGIRSGRADLLHVYTHERTRFSGLDELREGTRGELVEMLHGDARDLVGLFHGRDAEATILHRLLDALHGPVTEEPSAAQTNVVLVGDCIMTDIAAFLRGKLSAVDISASFSLFYFSAWMGKALSVGDVISDLERAPADVIGMSFLTYQGIPPYVALMAEADRLGDEELSRRVDQIDAVIRECVAEVRKASTAPILLHGACGLPMTRRREVLPFIRPFSRRQERVIALLNERIRELCNHTENVVFLDEAALVEKVGTRAANRRLIPRIYTHGKLFHPSRLGPMLADPYVEVVEAYARLNKGKVLLVDFDNTLWEGVMAEGQVQHNAQAQRLLKRLRDAGILLVSVSKNDPESIRWDELELEYSDFVLHKVSWNLKVQSIEEAAHQLDLGLDSFVLVDDSPVERELVTSRLPQVTVMDPGDSETWRQLALMLDFPNTRATAEAARRTEMYRDAAARRDALSGGADYPGMMRSLELEVRFGPASERHIDRIHELVDRTNQFNTTTIRRSRAELLQLVKDPASEIYVGSLSDKFGDLGIVGVSIVRREADTLVFDSVIMSCRAMGFGFETVLIRGPIDNQEGCMKGVGRFVPTARNRPCASLFADSGFTEVAPGEWELDLSGPVPDIPAWLDVGSI